MTQYLLPCTCGAATPVSSSQAGQSVRCVCGANLEVPTLRGLQQLAIAGDADGRRGRAWDDRHRTAFVVFLLALCPLMAAGYLWARIPPKPVTEVPDGLEFTDDMPAEMVMMMLRELNKGIDYIPPAQEMSVRMAAERRTLTLWGIVVSLGLAATGLVVAGLTLWSPGGRQRRGAASDRIPLSS